MKEEAAEIIAAITADLKKINDQYQTPPIVKSISVRPNNFMFCEIIIVATKSFCDLYAAMIKKISAADQLPTHQF